MIHAIRPIHETEKDHVLTIELSASTSNVLTGLGVFLAGIAVTLTFALNKVFASQSPAVVQAYPVILFCVSVYALLKCSGKRLVIDKPKACVIEGSALFGFTHSTQKSSLNGYSGVQISALEESWIVELTGFEKPKLKLVEFASEDHARDFANRLRLFLQS